MKLRITVLEASVHGARLYPWGDVSGAHGASLKAGDAIEIEGENVSMHGTDGDPIPGASATSAASAD